MSGKRLASSLGDLDIGQKEDKQAAQSIDDFIELYVEEAAGQELEYAALKAVISLVCVQQMASRSGSITASLKKAFADYVNVSSQKEADDKKLTLYSIRRNCKGVLATWLCGLRLRRYPLPSKVKGQAYARLQRIAEKVGSLDKLDVAELYKAPPESSNVNNNSQSQSQPQNTQHSEEDDSVVIHSPPAGTPTSTPKQAKRPKLSKRAVDEPDVTCYGKHRGEGGEYLYRFVVDAGSRTLVDCHIEDYRFVFTLRRSRPSNLSPAGDYEGEFTIPFAVDVAASEAREGGVTQVEGLIRVEVVLLEQKKKGTMKVSVTTSSWEDLFSQSTQEGPFQLQ